MEELIEGVNAKVCGCCKELKLFSEFSKDNRNKQYGLQYRCKQCYKKYSTDNSEKVLAKKKEYRTKNKEDIARKEAEYRKLHPEKVKALNARYYLENKDKCNASSSAYYEENKSKCLEWQSNYRKENSEKYKEYLKQYRIDNLEHLQALAKEWYSENSESVKKRVLQWAKDNPSKTRALGAKRRSAKLNRTPPWLTEQDLSDIEDFYYLAKALTDTTGVKYVVDHIIPLQGKNVSGLHVPSNLQILTDSENASKHNKYTIE